MLKKFSMPEDSSLGSALLRYVVNACFSGCAIEYSELQIRGGIEDNSKIIFLISQNICCHPSLGQSQ